MTAGRATPVLAPAGASRRGSVPSRSTRPRGHDLSGPAPEQRSTTERAGGVETFHRIVDRFYEAVEDDPLLRPMYPEDLEPGKTHLALFLAQYFGAGPVYSSRRGHPRLRMRHAEFPVTPEAAARWAALMSDAIVAEGLDEDVEQELLAYVVSATPKMINALPDDAEELPTSR